MSATPAPPGYFKSFGKTADSEFMPELAGAALQDSPRRSRIIVWLTCANKWAMWPMTCRCWPAACAIT